MSRVYRLIPRRSSAPVRAIQRRQAAAPPPATEPESETADYGALLKPELVALAEEQGVDSSGTKADIIERLEADDAG